MGVYILMFIKYFILNYLFQRIIKKLKQISLRARKISRLISNYSIHLVI